jgi:hypothetical protein
MMEIFTEVPAADTLMLLPSLLAKFTAVEGRIVTNLLGGLTLLGHGSTWAHHKRQALRVGESFDFEDEPIESCRLRCGEA